eukprot:TRINITY_DN744_c0_g1_i10.p2 TRINITY_DN744_c0_g1~~TRINITY_DN744_c0_g1_i10.p2  ORF type:complete len:105 (+),score=21.85 TRINITY_DN744_c0_g1_i10:766-1080(+)
MKLSSPRGNLASASLDDSVFFAGGEYFSNLHGLISSPVVDLYNLSTGEWSQFSLSFPRTNLAAASRGNFFQFFEKFGVFSMILIFVMIFIFFIMSERKVLRNFF